MVKQIDSLSFLSGNNAHFLDEMYAQYKKNPDSVSDQWKTIFQKTDNGDFSFNITIPTPATGLNGGNVQIQMGSNPQEIEKSVAMTALINSYRQYGHLKANLDPLGLSTPQSAPELEASYHGLNLNDSGVVFQSGENGQASSSKMTTVQDITDEMQQIYCQNIGFEFMHVTDSNERQWLQNRIESRPKTALFNQPKQAHILDYLLRTEDFERFLHTKFPGAKRFGIEGGESLIPALELVLEQSASQGVKEVVFGMAHRGRLSVLATLFEMPLRKLFAQFQGVAALPEDVDGSGDVKYHLGLSSNRQYGPNTLHLSLTSNPSHLEAVNPVALGKVRAKQDILQDTERQKVLGVLIHGDAAFAGQGLVAESLQLAYLKGYTTGGTLHIIINNQIGFTTHPSCSRSTIYSSDISKIIGAPVFHVNGDDPEAVCWAAQLAADYRHTFHKDVVIDMICYRRLGHNESDEPNFTQPLMYKKINNHPTTRTQYEEKLLGQNSIKQEEASALKAKWETYLRAEFDAASNLTFDKVDWLEGAWQGISVPKNYEKLYREQYHPHPFPTGVDKSILAEIGQSLFKFPEGFGTNSKIERQFEAKKKLFMPGENGAIDWATGEALAFGSLLLEGHPIRFTGQDVQRGTFSHRHAVLTDQSNEQTYIPLNNLDVQSTFDGKQAQIEMVNSLLSEAAVLGFEYGYSSTTPNTLVLWEAQFGDFVNGAQIIIDQFISASESKWHRLSGLVMLLPHGFEGQGPEHSSARFERFLQLCAENNMQVVNCSTPANYFHVLRRQIKNETRKPLIIMTPKSLLRHKLAVSPLQDLEKDTQFEPVLVSPIADPKKIKKIVLCTGKVYYDLLKAQEEGKPEGKEQIHIIRLEQLYPFPFAALAKHMKDLNHAQVIWCQEEPKNMGAWTFLEPRIADVMEHLNFKSPRPEYVGRPASASPATGFLNRHNQEQDALVTQALS